MPNWKKVVVSGSSPSFHHVSASGDVVAAGDVVAYYTSDIRLKDNIEVIKGSLDKIDGIRGVEFDWNEKSPGWAQERGHDVGVIAQEVQKVLPEIVTERTNGYLGVDYKRLIPLLIESIKELKQEVEDLKKKVNQRYLLYIYSIVINNNNKEKKLWQIKRQNSQKMN